MIAYARVVVVAVAESEGFDADAALSKVGMPDPSIVVRQQKTKRGTLLPWCGVVDESVCQGVRVNHNLYTQCKNEKACDGSYCKTCGESGPKYGDISERSSEEFAYKEKVVRYSTVMAKLGISREEAEEAASSAGITIAEAEFEVVTKGQRGRPRKLTDTSSSSESESGEPKKRGRPRKQKAVVQRSSGEDLIASLMANAEVTSTASDESDASEFDAAVNEAEKQLEAKEAEKQAKLLAKEAEKQEKLAAKEAEKQEKLAAKEAEKQAKLAAKAEADAAKLLAKAAKEEEKQAKLAAKAVEAKAEADAAKLETKEEENQTMTVEVVGHQSRPTIVAPASDVEESDQEEEEEEEESDQEVEDTEVEEFTWKGVDYILEPTTGVMYNKDVFLETGDGETVGKYDSLANTVEFV